MRSIGSIETGYTCATNARVFPLLIYFSIIALLTVNDALIAGKTCMMRRAAEALKLDQNTENAHEVGTI